MPRRFDKLLLACVGAFALSSCASYPAPSWSSAIPDGSGGSRSLDLSEREDVEYYLDLHAESYDKLLKSAELSTYLFEFPVVAAAVAVPAGVALGKGEKFVIKTATAGVAGSALSNWIQPRQRMLAAVQGRGAATCIKREFVLQQGYRATAATVLLTARQLTAVRDAQKAGLVGPNALNAAANVTAASVAVFLQPSGDTSDDGRLAIVAADDVVSKVKVRLINAGAAPDFAQVLAAVKAQYEAAKAKTEAVTESPAFEATMAEGADAAKRALEKLNEYPLRLAECAGKVP